MLQLQDYHLKIIFLLAKYIEDLGLTMEFANRFRFDEQDKDWGAWLINYDLRQLRRESEHLLKKSKERELSVWEQERFRMLSHEIAMLSVAATNCELTELLAA